MTVPNPKHLARFQSLRLAPLETRRLLRDRFERKLRVYRQGRYVNPDLRPIPDEQMLRLLQGLQITVVADWSIAEKTYADANPPVEAKDLKALIEAGWVRSIWGRIAAGQEVRLAVYRAADGTSEALRALFSRLHVQTYQGTEALRADAALGALLAAVEKGEKDPNQLSCRNPAWVASRLWEERSTVPETRSLRRWVDRWGLLQQPPLVPSHVWGRADAEAFCATAIDVISTESSLTGWPETRAAYLQRYALVHSASVSSVESWVPSPPRTLVDRALWLEGRGLEESIHETFETCGDIFGLVRLLLADAAADDHAPAPHPMMVRLTELGVQRAELFLELLYRMRATPKLLADLLLHPPSAALTCLLIAQWRTAPNPWDRTLVERDDRVGQADALADAAAILGEYVKDGKTDVAEAAALLNWFHDRAGPAFIEDSAGRDTLRETLLRELASVPKTTLRVMVTSLDEAGVDRGLGASEFATVLELVDLGALAGEIELAPVVNAYVQSVRRGDYGLNAHRVGAAGAAALAHIAARTPELRREFLYPLEVSERLAAGKDDNPYMLADSIGRSIRAHIRVLCRALIGSPEAIAPDIADALNAAVRIGALDHKEKGRVAAFAPRFERSTSGPMPDRELAADLAAALHVLSGAQQTALLEAILETDEQLLLAQLLSRSPPSLRARIRLRISALAPADAGVIRSHCELQARIDELLTAGAADAAALYMEAEMKLDTRGPVSGRELTRFQNQLRLLYLRNNWSAILNTSAPGLGPAPDNEAAQESLKFFKAIAVLKGPNSDPVAAGTAFAELFARRPTTALATNWFAAEISRFLKDDHFGILKGSHAQEARGALAELERMLPVAPAGVASDNEVIECNKALLLLALGEPGQALAVMSSVAPVRLQDTVAAYRAIALARLGDTREATAVLDAAEHTHGVTTVLGAARAHIASNAPFNAVPGVSLQEDLFQDVASAIARFKGMNPLEQARALHPGKDPFESLVVEYVRAAADSVVSLVPMMKGVQIDEIEDDLTAFIQHLLAGRVQFLGWSLADQSRGGFTAKGNPGERDLVLMWGNTVLALIEAVVCDRSLTHDSMLADLESHFQKLLGYGNPRLFFHLTYAFTDDLAELMKTLESIAQSAHPPGFAFKGIERIPRTDSRPPGFVGRYSSDFGDEVKVIFLVLNLGQSRQRQAAKMAAATKARKSPRSKKDSQP